MTKSNNKIIYVLIKFDLTLKVHLFGKIDNYYGEIKKRLITTKLETVRVDFFDYLFKPRRDVALQRLYGWDFGFNPAEAREGFKRDLIKSILRKIDTVSIQPKPEKGLKVVVGFTFVRYTILFQSSRSQRRV